MAEAALWCQTMQFDVLGGGQENGTAIKRLREMPIHQCLQVAVDDFFNRTRERVQLVSTQKVLLEALDRLQQQLV